MLSGPVAITAMVSSPFAKAALWAQMSAPSARPLMILGRSLVLDNASTLFSHHSFPYSDRSLVPTIAISLLGRNSSPTGVLLFI